MSHIVKVKTAFKDLDALEKACRALGLGFQRGQRTRNIYTKSVTADTWVELPGWEYPVAIDKEGTAIFDNYNESWGNIERLRDLQQSYGEQCAMKFAEENNYTVERTLLETGEVELELTSNDQTAAEGGAGWAKQLL